MKVGVVGKSFKESKLVNRYVGGVGKFLLGTIVNVNNIASTKYRSILIFVEKQYT